MKMTFLIVREVDVFERPALQGARQQHGGAVHEVDWKWYYRVDLWVGKTCYEGTRRFKQRGDALRAAKRTGAKPREAQR